MGNVVTYLDTHVAVWLAAAATEKITPLARRHLQAHLRISPMVLLELEYLYEIKRITLSANDVLSKLRHELLVEVCDLTFQNVVNTAATEKWTRDPFDRLIVAQAKANGWSYLISSDDVIRSNYLRAVW